MSLRDTLLERLEEYGISELRVDRDALSNGAPCVEIKANVNGRDVRITYAKQNGMSNEDMADVLASYLRRSFKR